MTAPTDCLLKFDTPELIENLGATSHRRKAAPVEAHPNKEVNEFLDTLIPPRTMREGAMEYRLHASSQQTSRSDVLKLEEQLDQLLQEKKARDKGICPVRAELFEDCMYELVRQVALDLRERGSLLKEVKDELDKTISAYNALYEASAAHGIRKAVHGEQNKNELKADNDKLEAEIKAFEDRIGDLNKRMEEAEKNDIDETAAREKEHAEKVAELRAENTVLRQSLEERHAPPKPSK